jgi:hypothetical protein
MLGWLSHADTYPIAASTVSGGDSTRGFVAIRMNPKMAGEARPISAEELIASSHHAWAGLCCGKADTTA